MFNTILPIIQSTWNTFANMQALPKVVSPSIPILWFGDTEAYSESKLKIVTVGLNPSCWEFKDAKGSPFQIGLRFPKASKLLAKNSLTSQDARLYYEAMNEYFKYNPYSKWFKNNERVLNELDASYNAINPEKVKAENENRKFKHTAVHIDIYAPIATDPVWGGLNKSEKSQICSVCKGMFKDIMSALDPDIIIVAANQGEISKNFINANGQKCNRQNADFDCTISSSNYIRGYRLIDGKKLIWGNNCNGQPFSSVNPLCCRISQLLRKI